MMPFADNRYGDDEYDAMQDVSMADVFSNWWRQDFPEDSYEKMCEQVTEQDIDEFLRVAKRELIAEFNLERSK